MNLTADNPVTWVFAFVAATAAEYGLYAAVAAYLIRRARRLAQDDRGVAAIEFAIVAPVLLAMIAGAFDLWQATSQRAAVVTTAGNISAIGGRALKTAGVAGAKAAVQAAYAANVSAGLFTAGSVPHLGDVKAFDANGSETADNDAAVSVGVTVSADCVPFFPFPGMTTFHASVTARG